MSDDLAARAFPLLMCIICYVMGHNGETLDKFLEVFYQKSFDFLEKYGKL